MSALRERTRRFWTSTLFVLLGPAALCLASFALYWQTTSSAALSKSTRMSQKLRYDVALGSHEQLQPGVQRFVNVEIYSQDSDEPILFCPEIYKLRLSDTKLLHAFATSFDERGCKNEAGNDATELPTAEWSPSEFDSNRDYMSFADATYNSVTNLRNYTLLVLPQVFYRSSQISEVVRALNDKLTRAVGDVGDDAENVSALCVVANDIQLLSDEEYSDITRSETSRDDVKTKSELVGIFRTFVFQTPRGDYGINETSTQNEVVAFSSEAPKFEKFRALHFNTPQTVRTDALFELQKMSSSVPYYVSIVRNKLENTTRIEYDSITNATPGSLASRFVPFLNVLDQKGWFKGRIIFRWTEGRSENFWEAQLDDFHLCNCELEELSRKFDLPSFTGIITDLSITNGQICGGVFCGEGSIKVSAGTIPVRVVQRLAAMRMLEASPRQALQLRFINDATPFNELELQFSLDKDGILVNSNYRNKIIAYYEKGTVKFGLFLPEEIAGQRTPYADSLSALFESQDARAFWNPMVRNALNHLPVPETAGVQSQESILR